jgi:hypothetical protein
MYKNPIRNEYGMERQEPELSEVDGQIAEMQNYRAKLVREASKKQLDPIVELAVTLAHEAGELKGRYEGQHERNEKQLKTINGLRSKLEDLEGIRETADLWRDKATELELTLKRSRARRR